MSAICYRRRIRVPSRDCILVGQLFQPLQNAIFICTFSSDTCTSSVCENDPQRSFTVSYLIKSCGMSVKDAIFASKKLCFNSPEKPDAVLKLLRDNGFTDAHISRLVASRPPVLLTRSPKQTLLPKLDFFYSIGVPRPVLAQKLSMYPSVLTRSLEKSLIPSYMYLKGLLQSDKSVTSVFLRAPWTFGRCSEKGISSNVSMLRQKGVPEPSIVALVMHQPSLLVVAEEKLAAYVDRAVGMGFDTSKVAFLLAIRVFNDLKDSTMEHKVEVYRRCGWSESDIRTAFLRYPLCMALSENKIMASMDFLVNTFSYDPAAIAQCPLILNFSLEKRIKPRCLIAMILSQKGLFKITKSSFNTLLKMLEEKFLERYVVKYEKDIPEISDIYRVNSRSINSPKPRAQDI